MPRLKQKRRAVETAEKRQVIARLYLQGVTQEVIGKKLGMTQPAISQHLTKVREDWRQSAMVDFNERKSIEVAKLDEVERNAYEAWAKSRTGPDGKISGPGNPRFLDVIVKCIQQRKEIFGLNAPIELVGGVSLPWLEEDTETEIEATVSRPEPEKIDQ